MLQGKEIRWGLLHEGDVLLDRSHPCAINVGSVGQPRDDDPRAAYGIIDTEIGLFTLRRVAYDIDMAIQRIRESGIPEENALRLLKGE
jgi:diadenosine tetraphosphatase ApaH/serine/threonine PP2A family protein phosphatase